MKTAIFILFLFSTVAGSDVAKAMEKYVSQQKVTQDRETELFETISDSLRSLSLRFSQIDANQTELLKRLDAAENAIVVLSRQAKTNRNCLSILEAFMNARGGYTALSYSQCNVASTGRLLFDISKQALMICNGSSWVHSHPSHTQSSEADSKEDSEVDNSANNAARDCAEIATRRRNAQSGHYFVLDKTHSNSTKVYCDFERNVSLGGDGKTKPQAGLSCKTIKYHWPKQTSGRKWINPKMPAGEAFEIYCDFDSFGGGWSMVYSSRDDDVSGDNNMQNGTRETASITTLDPGNANKKLAFDVFQAIRFSATGYSEVMLSGYQDYQNKTKLVKMYFSKEADTGRDFTHFITENIGKNSFKCSGFIGTEKSSGKKITLSWEHQAFIAGATNGGCSWSREVWNEIDDDGGHILAPADWDHAEDHRAQTAGGACHQRGLFHIFIR